MYKRDKRPRNKRTTRVKYHPHPTCPWKVIVVVALRINVDLAIFQPYLDLEAGDNQSLKIQVARPGIEPRSSCSASQELNHSATAAPWKVIWHEKKFCYVYVFTMTLTLDLSCSRRYDNCAMIKNCVNYYLDYTCQQAVIIRTRSLWSVGSWTIIVWNINKNRMIW